MKQWFSGQLVAIKDTMQITAGNVSAVYTHNLGYAPWVGKTELDDLGGAYSWVDTVTATQFTLHVSSPDPVNNHTFGIILV